MSSSDACGIDPASDEFANVGASSINKMVSQAQTIRMSTKGLSKATGLQEYNMQGTRQLRALVSNRFKAFVERVLKKK